MAFDSLLQLLDDKFQQNLNSFREKEEAKITEYEKALVRQLDREVEVYRELQENFVEDTFLKRKNELLMSERKKLDELKEDCFQSIFDEIKTHYQLKLESNLEFQNRFIQLILEVIQIYNPFQIIVFESLYSKIEEFKQDIQVLSSHDLLGFFAISDNHKIEHSLQNIMATRLNEFRVRINYYMEMD